MKEKLSTPASTAHSMSKSCADAPCLVRRNQTKLTASLVRLTQKTDHSNAFRRRPTDFQSVGPTPIFTLALAFLYHPTHASYMQSSTTPPRERQLPKYLGNNPPLMSPPQSGARSSYYDLTTKAVIPEGAWQHAKFELGQEVLYGDPRDPVQPVENLPHAYIQRMFKDNDRFVNMVVFTPVKGGTDWLSRQPQELTYPLNWMEIVAQKPSTQCQLNCDNEAVTTSEAAKPLSVCDACANLLCCIPAY
jgi:hypothetical protein